MQVEISQTSLSRQRLNFSTFYRLGTQKPDMLPNGCAASAPSSTVVVSGFITSDNVVLIVQGNNYLLSKIYIV